MKGERIPETDSVEELARFWDSHDLTDFEDQLEEVPEPVFQGEPGLKLSIRLNLRIPGQCEHGFQPKVNTLSRAR